MSGARRVDLNADVGEGGADEALVRWVTSMNVACGGHAGDAATMERVVAIAADRGVAIGAHPGYEDRARFGREETGLSPREIEALVLRQSAALAEIVARRGVALGHVKPHGALYNRAARDAAAAAAVARGVARLDRSLRLVGLAGSVSIDAARGEGLETLEEGFADRAYLADGRLAPRDRAGAVHDDPADAARQAVALACGDPVPTLDGAPLSRRVDTICLHGDRPSAVAFAAAVRAALEAAGVTVVSPAPARGVSGRSTHGS